MFFLLARLCNSGEEGWLGWKYIGIVSVMHTLITFALSGPEETLTVVKLPKRRM